MVSSCIFIMWIIFWGQKHGESMFRNRWRNFFPTLTSMDRMEVTASLDVRRLVQSLGIGGHGNFMAFFGGGGWSLEWDTLIHWKPGSTSNRHPKMICSLKVFRRVVCFFPLDTYIQYWRDKDPRLLDFRHMPFRRPSPAWSNLQLRFFQREGLRFGRSFFGEPLKSVDPQRQVFFGTRGTSIFAIHEPWTLNMLKPA